MAWENLPTLWWSLLPEQWDIVDTSNSIQFIGQLFSWPAMQSLIRLSPYAVPKSWYMSWIGIMWEVVKTTSEEEWKKRVDDFNRRYPNGMISFGTDCSNIQEVIEDIDQLRLLWDNQLITSEAFRYIFAEMSDNEKTNHTELIPEDGKRMDFGELEMQSLIACGIAVRWFNDEMNAKIRALMN